MKQLLFLSILFLVSCSDNGLIKRMEQIKTFGNNNPEKALVMLDSLEIEIRSAGDYAKHKYDLLRVRLNDKADHMPSSDIMIKELMAYVEEEGSIPDKQEVYYYAGSTYRDLQDTPRALEYFFKSLDFAIGHPKECDPIMLRNTYSNLNYLYYQVQDYPNALETGLKELESCRQTRTNVVVPFVHIGAAYIALDSLQQAETALDSAYTHIVQSGNISQYQKPLTFVMYHYAFMGKKQKTKDCANLITGNPLDVFDATSCMAFAWYYESLEKYDSASIYLKRVLDDGTDVVNMYDAATHLFRIYSEAGDEHNATLYAKTYLELSDSLDFGKRQELAATVNNQYKYHLDQKKEQQLKDEKERYRQTLIIVLLLALLLGCVGYILNVRRRNRHLQEVIALSTDIKAKEQQLTEQTEQNKAVIRMLHQWELEGKAEDVVQTVRQTSIGKGEMTAADWKKLYQAVDELYPTFKDRLLQELGTFTEQQMQVCYLMRIGLSKTQIQNMTNLSRSTVWRWVKKYGWVHAEGKE